MNNLKEILVAIFNQRKEDDKLQEATNKYFEVYAPDTYAPFVDWKVWAMLQVIKLQDESLYEEIEYWLYEAPHFYKDSWVCTVTEADWTKVEVRNDKEAIKYIITTNEKN